MRILKETLENMEDSFSSNEFSLLAQAKGLSKKQISTGIIANFLHKECTQGLTKRTWYKSKVNKLNNDNQELFYINFLKERGYKIYKQTISWEEIK